MGSPHRSPPSLLDGDGKGMKDRLENINFAMAWIKEELEDLKESDRSLMEIFKHLQGDVLELTDICREIGAKRSGRHSSDWSQRFSTDSIDFDFPSRNSARWSQTDVMGSLELSVSHSSGSSAQRDLESTLESSTPSSDGRNRLRESTRQPQPSVPPAPAARTNPSPQAMHSRANLAKVAPEPQARCLTYTNSVRVLPVSSKVSAVPAYVPNASLSRTTSLRMPTTVNGGGGVPNGLVGGARAKEVELPVRKLDTTGGRSARVEDSVVAELKPSTSDHSGSDSFLGPDDSPGASKESSTHSPKMRKSPSITRLQDESEATISRNSSIDSGIQFVNDTEPTTSGADKDARSFADEVLGMLSGIGTGGWLDS